MLAQIDRALAWNLPGDRLKDLYPRGMRRLAEYGWLRGWHTVTTRYGFRMNVNRLDAIKWCIYYFGQFEPRISRAFANFLRPGETVIDIGANVGYHTLLAATRVGPTGRVLSFEPSSRNFAELSANVILNALDNVVLNRVAVSDAPGTVDLYFGGENAQGDTSIVGEKAGRASETVRAITFDDIVGMCDLETVSLIKIDVEGAESLVLSRMIPHMSRLRPDCAIFLEISPGNTGRGEELLRPFLAHGYHIRSIENEYDPKFFRSDEAVKLSEMQLVPGKIVDVVLSRDPACFDRLSG